MKEIKIGRTVRTAEYESIMARVTYDRRLNETEEQFQKRAMMKFKLYRQEVESYLLAGGKIKK